ncbi:hypothetical protein CJU89_3808 [Yarrowia sp. B02]|nr:hypothetical protein CJU89_3808 [Yarrowia sp. B02]
MSHYFTPVGGNIRQITKDIVIHSCPFTRAYLFNFGGRMTCVKLPSTEVVLFAPTPICEQSEAAVKLLAGDSPNVKYLVAPDFEHYMAIKAWKEKFPQAVVIGPEELAEKLTPEGINLDIGFKPSEGNKLLTGPALASVGFPKELVDTFDAVYLPSHGNKEIMLYHKHSETLLEADAIFNTPSTEQYKGSNVNPKGSWGIPNLMNYMGFDSYLQKRLWKTLYVDPGAAKKAYTELLTLPIKRIIPCHGDLIELPPAEIKSKLEDLMSVL